ncbi:MAG: mitochondrial fission ELM1 family protein, partial [Alphaproteobacteria bacterium]|nr:mitochondrial fission ELM1 family protein [Alphaproteobacteria bacterium]
MEIWVLKDTRTGTFNQALGIAEAIKQIYGHDFIIKDFDLAKFAKLPNWFFNLFPGLGLSMAKSTRHGLLQGRPDIVIAAGRRQCPAVRFIQKHHNPAPLTAFIMDPNGCYGKFDLIAIPKHDSFKRAGKNILRITGAPSRVRDERLNAEASKWSGKFAHLPRPWVALIIGG